MTKANTNSASSRATENVYIPLKLLVASPLNVRKLNAEKQADKELVESIRANGLLQNLVVVPAENGNKFEVIAGGRRYGALKALQKAKAINGEYQVQCQVKDRSEAVMASLDENVAREDMHPVDKFKAYAALATDQKMPLKDIAKAFGTTQQEVKKMLKLGGLAPEVLEAFGGGKIDLSDAMTFTLADDHAKQIEALNAYEKGEIRHWQLKGFILGGEQMESTHRMVKLVGMKAYKAAGGTVTEDLFGDKTFINDPALVNRLGLTLLEDKAEEVKSLGWKWVLVQLDSYITHDSYSHAIEGELVGVPGELTARIAELEKQMDDLEEEEDEGDDWHERYGKLDDERDTLLIKQEEYRTFTPNQMAKSGAYVLCNSAGEIEVRGGYVSHADAKVARKAGGAVGKGGDAQDDGLDESMALKDSLRAYRLQATKAALLKCPDLANQVLQFSMVDQILCGGRSWGLPLGFRADAWQFKDPADIGETLAAQELNTYHEKLDLTWANHESGEERFEAFLMLSDRQRQDLVTYAVSDALSGSDQGTGRRVAVRAGLDVGQYWKPTAQNYYKRLGSVGLQKLATEQLGEAWYEANKGSKKSDLAAAMEAEESMASWLPDSIQ